MSWNDIKADILKACGTILEPKGFRFLKARKTYVKPIPAGRLMVQFVLTATDHGNYYGNVGCGVRNDKIEEIVNLTATFDKIEKPHTTTISVFSQKKWHLNSTEEIAVAIAGFKSFIQEEALPFLQTEYSFQDLSNMLNSSAPGSGCVFCNSFRRFHRGLAAAKLAGDARYDELKKQYWSYFKTSSNGFYLPEFEQCLKNIEAIDSQNGSLRIRTNRVVPQN